MGHESRKNPRILIALVTNPDGTTDGFRSFQRIVTALDQWCPFRNHDRVVEAIRRQRAATYGRR